MTWKIQIQTDAQTIEYTTDTLQNITEEIHGTVQSIKATTSLEVATTDYLFLNGYQTWTYNKEMKVTDSLRGLQHVPQKLIDQYHFDRYGDYHFHAYPKQKGIFHGYTYMYLRKGNKYHLLASINEDLGYTIFNYENNTLTIEKDCVGVKLDGTYTIFDIYEQIGSEEEVFDGWFNAMNIPKQTQPKLYGYSSWYNHYENISTDTIQEDLEGCKIILQENDLFQIDDGWQPCTGDWLEYDPNKFPHGLRYETDRIHKANFKAGIWVSPFLASVHSKLVKEHPDWLLKVNGEPWFVGCNWDGAYALDIDHPEVIQYLKDVFDQIFNEWNFDLVKLDFLYAAAPFGTESESRAHKMKRAILFLKELCKDHPILGCGVPFCSTLGIFEYNRVGCDVGLDWNDVWYMRLFHRERVSTKHSLANTIFRRQINTRGYLSDPDVFFLRDENLKLTEQQKEMLITIDALLGGVFLTSDNPSNYTSDQIDKYHHYRHLSTATNIHTNMYDKILTIQYDLDGKTNTYICDTSIL